MEQTPQKKAVEDFFDANRGWQGGLYGQRDDHYGLLTQRRREYVEEILRRIIARGSGRAADVGCGAGIYLPYLEAMGYRVYGVDLSSEMVRVARERSAAAGGDGRIHLLRGDVEHLPFADGSLSLVIAVGVLDYLVDDQRALAGIRRILAPGGVFLVNVRNESAFTTLHSTVKTRFRELLGGRNPFPGNRVSVRTEWILREMGYHYKKYFLGNFERYVAGFGFERLEGRTFGYDFKLLTALGLRAPARRLERWCEKVLSRIPLPYLPYSGMAYIGVFRKT